jgi:hypothetical protein
MTTDFLQKIKEFHESPEGKKALQEFAEKIAREHKRKEKAKDYLLSLSKYKFDKLVSRLIAENGEERRDKCWKERCEPYPTNLMYLLFDGASLGGKQYDKVLDRGDSLFGGGTFKFRGYYFNSLYGQGVIHRIFNSRKEEIFNL